MLCYTRTSCYVRTMTTTDQRPAPAAAPEPRQPRQRRGSAIVFLTWRQYLVLVATTQLGTILFALDRWFL
jgi:hypothetical protein